MQFAQITSIGYWSRLWGERGDDMLAALVRVVFIAVGYLILRFILFKLVGRVLDLSITRVGEAVLPARQARVMALRTVLRSAIGFVLAFVAAIMVLQAVGIPIIAPITTAGVLGLAVGFGAQKLVKDVISGFFILVEDQYGVGDYVTIGSVTGVVEEMGMRITSIRDKAGKLFTIANGDITQVCNFSRGKLCIVHEVSVPSTTDIPKAQRVLNEIGAVLARDYPNWVTEEFVVEGLAQVSGASATIRLRGCVVPVFQDDAKMELNKRIRSAFAENDLQLT